MGDTLWDIDLCEKHGDALERELYAWGLLGRAVEEHQTGRMFGSNYGSNGRRLAELRTQQSREDRETVAAARQYAVTATGTELLARAGGPRPAAPEDAGAWVFTEHAIERMEERNVRAIDAVWAASAPTVKRPGKHAGLMVHERGDTKVVVNPATKVIITVALPERKAIAL
ncbi:hypothetical protein [Intrasporangium mesophilum]